MGVAQAAWSSPDGAGLCAATVGEGQVDAQPLRCVSVAAVTGHSADCTKRTRETSAQTSPPRTKKSVRLRWRERKGSGARVYGWRVVNREQRGWRPWTSGVSTRHHTRQHTYTHTHTR